MKSYRFFYHYYRQLKRMSVHFKGKCYVVQNIVCDVPCETKFNRTQPYLVMRGFARSVRISDDIAYISNRED